MIPPVHSEPYAYHLPEWSSRYARAVAVTEPVPDTPLGDSAVMLVLQGRRVPGERHVDAGSMLGEAVTWADWGVWLTTCDGCELRLVSLSVADPCARDFFDFVRDFLNGVPSDLNGDGVTNSQDVFDYLAGCGGP